MPIRQKSKQEKNEAVQFIMDMTVSEISKLAINNNTMLRIFVRIVDGINIKNDRDKYGLHDFKIQALSILYKAKPETSINCFQEIKTKLDDLVITDNKPEFTLWGKGYSIVHN